MACHLMAHMLSFSIRHSLKFMTPFHPPPSGIYRAAPLRVNPRMRNVKSVYRTHIDVIHFRRLDTKRLRGAGGDGSVPPN